VEGWNNKVDLSKDEFEYETTLAILHRYSGSDWDQILERFYADHPEAKGRKFIVLLLKDGRFKK
jgi:hypothetical protein